MFSATLMRLVLAQDQTGRWHGLSRPIIGDSSHGNSKTNNEWKELRETKINIRFFH